MRIQNFKGWEDTGPITMAPITLFFGMNSSGKSSIGQFLMLLKQTMESSDRKLTFHLGGKNSAVQFGSYREMIFHRDPEREMKFSYRWSLPGRLRVTDSRSRKPFEGDALDFSATVESSREEGRGMQISEFEYRLMSGDAESLSIGLSQEPGKHRYNVSHRGYVLHRARGRAWALKGTVRFYGFPDEIFTYYQNADFVQNLSLAHEKLFQSICYLGPLRTKADRLYAWSGSAPESVGFSGENTVPAILASSKRRTINFGYRRPAKSLEETVALKLKEMDLIEDFKVAPIAEQRQEYEVNVRTKGSKDSVGLPDVGFGISQVLPVLVQCFYAKPGSIIIMEQPEIHLHPRAQSALADVMIDVIKSRQDGVDRNIQLIIETHSEHFLRRLQMRIAEGKISRNEVSGYFANLEQGPVTLKELDIDEQGYVRNWPENFFGDEMEDVIQHAKAALKKRRQ